MVPGAIREGLSVLVRVAEAAVVVVPDAIGHHDVEVAPAAVLPRVGRREVIVVGAVLAGGLEIFACAPHGITQRRIAVGWQLEQPVVEVAALRAVEIRLEQARALLGMAVQSTPQGPPQLKGLSSLKATFDKYLASQQLSARNLILPLTKSQFLLQYLVYGFVRPGYFGSSMIEVRSKLDEWFSQE